MSIVLRDLSKEFQGMCIVSKVNLEIRDGEMFVLLGGSGSGKSTILRMISGLVRPDGGRIELHGRDVTNLPPQARGTGFVFQNYSIFRHMNVFENIEFGLRLRRVPRPERRRKSLELMDLVGLGGLGDRYASQLSGGQQQRVALARALAYEPAVLLLDEPFGALDVKIRVQLRRNLREIQRQLKVTSILVTHDQEEGFELADRIGVLEKGHLIEVGEPLQLYHRPASQFVATFVGGGNVLVGSIHENKIMLGSHSVPMPESAPAHLEGARARILIRPENLEVAEESKELSGHPLGKAEGVESVFVGASQRLRLEAPELHGVRCISPVPAYGQKEPHLESMVATRPDRLSFRVGQEVHVGVLHYHVLERTGLRSLILAEDSPSGAVAVEFGVLLAEATGAPATLLGVVSPRDPEEAEAARLDRIRQDLMRRLPNLRAIVRRGLVPEELLREVHDGLHEMIVMGEEGGPTSTRLSPRTQRLLAQSEVPVLLVQERREQVAKILICTGAGEPGKGDVWMGGRMAKRASARVTVAHVLREEGEGALERAQDHLQRAQASLAGMGLESEARLLRDQHVAPALLKEAEDGDYDLIVMGTPRGSSVVTRLVRGTTRPFLFVPLVVS